MISTFDGFSKVKHDNIIVLYFTRRDSGFKMIYALPGRTEQFSLYFERTDPYDSLSYKQQSGEGQGKRMERDNSRDGDNRKKRIKRPRHPKHAPRPHPKTISINRINQQHNTLFRRCGDRP